MIPSTLEQAKDLFRPMLKAYHAIISCTWMNRDQKIGYMIAAMKIDHRYYRLGRLDLQTAIRLVTEVFNEEGIRE